MRKLLICLAGASVAISASPAFAHPEDEHGSRYQRGPTTEELAQQAVVKLVTQTKLPASWTTARQVKSALRMKNGKQQMVVTFRNDAVRQAAKRMLFVIMTTDGEFVSANHKLA